ncbi:MAG: RNA polymerase sigma-70 factor [Prolixibacteraceae bacterium]|nr:RNA polymerase sigma-70 factor [Prolixibacteraceae bacterium]
MELPGKTSDNELITRIQNDEKFAFRELFIRYASRLHKFSYSYLKNKEDAEELIQNVFLTIWIKRDSIDASKNIRAFIYKITVNAIYDLIRKRKIERTFQNQSLLNQTSFEHQTWNSVLKNELQQNVYKLVDHLPEQQQRIFNLSKLEGYTNDEIAIKLGLSKRTVENHLYRAILFLKQNIGNNASIVFLFTISAFI